MHAEASEVNTLAAYSSIPQFIFFDMDMQQPSSTQQNYNNALLNALQSVQSQKDVIHKIKSLLDDGAEIDAMNNEGNTVLHISVTKNYGEVVKFLLTRGAKLNVKNKDKKTAIDLAKYNFNVTQILTASVNIPKDGNCLFWAAALSYLTPVKKKIGEFKQRVIKLFGSEKAANIKFLQQLIADYNPFSNSNTINDEAVKSLVTERFRERVVHYMSSKRQQFSQYVEGNFEEYLKTMAIPGSWGDKPEIIAISELLECAIVVDGNAAHIPHNSRINNSSVCIVLFHTCADHEKNSTNKNYYEFGVARDIIDDYERDSIEEDKYKTEESSATETIIPPHAEELEFDPKLKLGCPNFHEIMTDRLKNLTINRIEHLRSTQNYPTPKTLAQFAVNVYADDDRESVPEGWELLTTATNTAGLCNEYYGEAYWNPKTYQVVIAHRGSDLTKLSVWYTDLAGIVCNVTVPQMHSACTFAAIVCDELKKMSEKHKIQFQIFFTGHSLGGWLAQITTFSTKYLEIEKKLFQMSINKRQERWHAHTVVFDSPGCKETLAKLITKYDVRYVGRTVYLESLDITSYLSAPNIINTRNEHVGTLHRVFVEIKKTEKPSEWSLWSTINYCLMQIKGIPNKIAQYTKATHSKKNILLALDYAYSSGKPKILTVIDWPVSCITSFNSAEYIEFHEMAIDLNQYHIDAETTGFRDVVLNLKGRNPIRYQTKPYDGAKCSISVFTRYERQFLGKCELLQKFIPNFLESAVKDAIGDSTLTTIIARHLKNFSINDEYVTCETPEMMQEFVPYVKRLIFFYKDLQEKIDSYIKQPSLHFNRRVYEQHSYVSTKEFKDLCGIFNDGNDDVKQFLGDQEKKIMHVIVEHDLRSTSAKMYQAFLKMNNMDNCTVHTLKKLLFIEDTFVSLKTFLEEATKQLIIIQCEPIPVSDNFTAERRLFESVVSILKKKSHKIIVITRKDDEFGRFLNDEYNKQFLDKEYVTTEDNGAIWGELSPDAQQKMLRQKVVVFQGKKGNTSLEEIIGIEHVQMLSNELTNMRDSKTILQFIRNDPVNAVIIGSKPHCLRDIECPFVKNDFDIQPRNLANSLLNNTDGKIFMIMISSSNPSPDGTVCHFLRRLDANEAHLPIIKSMMGKTIFLHVDKDFHENCLKWMELCQSYTDKRIFWLEVSDERICCQQIYDANLYFKRQFDHREKIVFEETILQKRIDDTFIISGKKDEEVLKTVNKNVHFADTEESAEKLFSDQIESDIPCHWLRWEMIGEQNQLVWHRSHGSLQALRNHVSETSSPCTPIDEKLFITADGKMKVVIVSGEPGMGKSTTLTTLEEQVAQTNFVIRVDLKDCQLAMSNLPSKDHNILIENAVEFLAAVDSTGFSSNLAKTVLKYGLEGNMSREMFLLFDGFDEIIDNNHADNVVSLLQFLQKMNTTNIWITTREYRRTLLEDKLSVFATSFTKLLGSKQKEFLEKFWEISLSLQQHQIKGFRNKISKCANTILENAGSFFGQDIYSFMGIPLQTRMLAEVFQPSVETLNFNNSDFNGNWKDIHDLYTTFINMKYDIYFRKTGFSSCSTEQQNLWLTQKLHENHTRLAVKVLFPDVIDELLRFDNSKSDTRCLMELNRVGLVQSTHGDEKCSYIHRSFAEYFMADGLASCRLPINHLIFSEVLLKPDYKVVRLFLNLHLSQIKSEHNKLISYWEKFAILGFEKEEKYLQEGRETAFHVLEEENLFNVFYYLLNAFTKNEDKLSKLLSIRDQNEETVLYRLVKKGHSEMVEQLVECLEMCRVEVKVSVVLASVFRTAKDENDSTVIELQKYFKEYDGLRNVFKEIRWTQISEFLAAAQAGDLDKMKIVLSEMTPATGGQYLFKATDESKKTALHIASEHGHVPVVKYLLENKASVDAKDRDENLEHFTPMHYATKFGHHEIVTILLKENANINATDRGGFTPLHHAVRANRVSIVRLLLQNECDITIKDKTKMTAFAWAAKCGNLDIINSLMDMDMYRSRTLSIDDIDRNGMTALSHATKGSKWEVVKFLVDEGADVHKQDFNKNSPFSRAERAGKRDIIAKMSQSTSRTN